MHLTKPLSFLVKQMIKTANRSTALATLGLIVLAGGVLAGQNLLTTPQTAHAATPPDSCFAFNAGTGTITDYYNNEANNSANPACPRAVDIPATIGWVSVVSIGNSAFLSNQLTNVTIPEGVTSIGDRAFSNNQLTSVTIPSSVTSIGNGAFHSNNLTTVTFQGPVTTFGSDIFLNSNSPIASITYDGTTYTDTAELAEQCYAFSSGAITDYKQYDMNLIKNSGIACMKHALSIPSTIGGVAVTSIGNAAFRINQLTSVTIPSGVTSIGNGAFQNNQLTSVTIPSGVTSIGSYAFRSNQLTSVTIPSGVTSIGNGAFQSNQLTSVTISCGISTLGEYVFAINKLTDVSITSCITSIDSTAFFGQNPWGGVVESRSDPAHDWYSDDPAVRQFVFDNIWYARLYTADPTNPNGLKDGIADEWRYVYVDLNSDGDQHDSIGGHLINPSSTTTSYHSATGSELASNRIVTGRLSSGIDLTDYLVKNVQTPVIENSWDITPEEQQAIEDALSVYYRIGNTPTFTPSAITGYATPAVKTPTLSGANNQVSFIYKKDIKTVDFSTPSGSSTNPSHNSVPANLSPVMANSNFAVDADKDCSVIDAARLLPASDFAALDSGHTTLGGLDFALSCATPGEDATVSLSLAGQVSDPSTAKVYKKTAAGTITDITDQTVITNQSGRTTISYSLTDGGALDDDGIVNGTIVDPIYVTVPTESNQTLLASTGASLWSVAAAGMTLTLVGAVLAGRVTRRP